MPGPEAHGSSDPADKLRGAASGFGPDLRRQPCRLGLRDVRAP